MSWLSEHYNYILGAIALLLGVVAYFCISRKNKKGDRKKMKTLSNIAQLIDVIGAGNPDSSSRGPVVVEVKIWDGRIVRASYYKGSYNTADIQTSMAIIQDDSKLRPFVQKLLDKGKSFTILSGRSDQTCFLAWTISES